MVISDDLEKSIKQFKYKDKVSLDEVKYLKEKLNKYNDKSSIKKNNFKEKLKLIIFGDLLIIFISIIVFNFLGLNKGFFGTFIPYFVLFAFSIGILTEDDAIISAGLNNKKDYSLLENYFKFNKIYIYKNNFCILKDIMKDDENITNYLNRNFKDVSYLDYIIDDVLPTKCEEYELDEKIESEFYKDGKFISYKYYIIFLRNINEKVKMVKEDIEKESLKDKLKVELDDKNKKIELDKRFNEYLKK